jgi:hypothetical protein
VRADKIKRAQVDDRKDQSPEGNGFISFPMDCHYGCNELNAKNKPFT